MTGRPSVDKPWLQYYTEEMITTPIPSSTIYQFMYENNKDYPHDIAINYLGRKISYQTLFDNIDRTTKAFMAMGIKSGDIVTVALPSIPEALYCVYALNRLGAVANMIHPLAGENELAFYLNEVGSKVAVLFDKTYEIVRPSLDKTQVHRVIVVSAGESLPTGIKQLFFLKNRRIKLEGKAPVLMWWNQFIRFGHHTEIPAVEKDIHSTAIISHTGGTTGEPKGVMCSDHNINALIIQMGLMLYMKRQETQLVVLPPFVNYSLVNSMLEPIALGMTAILIPKYEPEKFFTYARKYRPNFIASIPPYWEALLKVKGEELYDLSFMRAPGYGGEAMDPKNEAAINVVFHLCGAPNKMAKGIGMTELGGASTFTPYYCEMGDSLGIPLQQSNCTIVDPETYEELTYDKEGEICFAGPAVMLGYYHNQAATDEIVKVHEDGVRWLHTGDLGRMDKNGRLYLTGRIKRIIMTKGKDGVITKLFPDRIEKAVNSHPDVDLSCVISVPDEERVNYPKAIVQLKPGVGKTREQLAEAIKKHCSEILPDYMIPDEIDFMDTLPRTSRGKVDYRALESLQNSGNAPQKET